MSDDELAARKKLGQDLRYWKKFQFLGFATGVLNLETAITSLETPYPFIYARQDYPSRWLICKVGSQYKAMFHTAAVWNGSSDLETGNYVPEGQVPPTQITEGRIQRNASNRCQFDYIVDTRYDKTLFSFQTKFEELVAKDPAFNKSCKPRRNWQKGDNGYDDNFTLSAQVFVRPYGYDVSKLKKPPYPLHPWIREVVEPTTGRQDYYANPHRPEIWDCTTGKMTRIDKADPPSLQKGDIVWMTFHVEFIIGMQTWATQLTPRHIIRVGKVPGVLLTATVEGNGVNEQEPDYTIQEGATFVMNVDFPMYDEMADNAKSDSSKVHTDVKSHGKQAESGANLDPGAKNRPEDEKPDRPVTNSEGGQIVDLECDDDRSDGTLTPLPASPAISTPVKSVPSPIAKPVNGESDAESKNSARGVKREEVAGDSETAPPAKRGRQTGPRRTRNA